MSQLEIVRVWVLRWSESNAPVGYVPTTPSVYLSEKEASDARVEWIRAIAEKRGINVDKIDTIEADRLRCSWRIDERFALKAQVNTSFGKGTRYFLLEDISACVLVG